MSFTSLTPHLLRGLMDWMVENRLADRINIMVRAHQLTCRALTTGAELDLTTTSQRPHRQAREDVVVLNLGGNACHAMDYVGELLQLHLAVQGWKALVTVPIDDILCIQVRNGDTLLGAMDLALVNRQFRHLDDGARTLIANTPTELKEADAPKDETNRSHLRLVK